MEDRRILAKFVPEAWINDQAVEVDGAYDFDVTDAIAVLGRKQALALRDNDYATDNLWLDHQISKERPHGGPFRIEVELAIAEYFDSLENA